VPLPRPPHPPGRIQIQALEPVIDCGRYPARGIVGDQVDVTATIFKDGHDTLGAALRVKAPGAKRWQDSPLAPIGPDRYAGAFTPDAPGLWSFGIVAWTDRIATWQDEVRRKVAGGQLDFAAELAEGAALLERDGLTLDEGLDAPAGDRSGEVVSGSLELDVDRTLARFGSWYELFPRSFGGFSGVADALPQLAELGFDVVYLPPIHPIGRTNRKGRNNTEHAKAGDVGSPWAIGAAEGGHDALHPDLGTWDEFDAMVAAARTAGIEIALDFAIQCSPDHPWLTEHPDWFYRRPDGTLKYAENPPKRYQDIYNVNFESPDWRALWKELRDIVVGWVERGITVFRVDNPHTKPIPFWQWLIREVRSRHPEVIFLAEAFTRPALMTTLAKAGFAQSYTYFTWKNSKPELEEFTRQLLEWSPFYRPNMFVNTPDILHAYLQEGGLPAFEARLVLAATLSPSYGIYSGFESCERVPVAPGSEEYLDSEKYEVRARHLDGPLLPLIRRVNALRRATPALQRFDNIRWLETEGDYLVAYAKDDLVCVVNVDPAAARTGICIVPAEIGLPPVFDVLDVLRDETFTWRTGRNYVSLAPGQSHLLQVGGEA
jgi:starch synthase (maltosyl-transferring)